jgi:hypothetical protein
MTLTSMSNYNVPFTGTTEEWGIFMSDGVYLRITMIQFDIKCNEGLLLSLLIYYSDMCI